MSNRALRRLLRQAQDASGLSRDEVLQLAAEKVGVPVENAEPEPARAPVNPLIRPSARPNP